MEETQSFDPPKPSNVAPGDIIFPESGLWIHDANYENEYGRFFKFEEVPILVYDHQGAFKRRLDGAKGTILSMGLVSEHATIIALSSNNNHVHIWNFETGAQIMAFNATLGNFMKSKMFVTLSAFCKTVHLTDEDGPIKTEYFSMLGMDDGSVLISEILFSHGEGNQEAEQKVKEMGGDENKSPTDETVKKEEDQEEEKKETEQSVDDKTDLTPEVEVTWMPLNVLKPTEKDRPAGSPRKMNSDSTDCITFLGYNDEYDTMLAGNQRCLLLLYPDLFCTLKPVEAKNEAEIAHHHHDGNHSGPGRKRSLTGVSPKRRTVTLKSFLKSKLNISKKLPLFKLDYEPKKEANVEDRAKEEADLRMHRPWFKLSVGEDDTDGRRVGMAVEENKEEGRNHIEEGLDSGEPVVGTSSQLTTTSNENLEREEEQVKTKEVSEESKTTTVEKEAHDHEEKEEEQVKPKEFSEETETTTVEKEEHDHEESEENQEIQPRIDDEEEDPDQDQDKQEIAQGDHGDDAEEDEG
eukprot:CAMPEP_0115046322 /NCGR_PEP_ID=MMETSP0216-20121206/48680_1 /TAXON_ID=223996 /ORGANISM="Protocruzia adherens, Strain Boccale" /LENGTH=520 /DNA_ID=CAMNT_0002429381 /DNA_START=105 /DNA_END=1664 /DNA_ORIENTATION=+